MDASVQQRVYDRDRWKTVALTGDQVDEYGLTSIEKTGKQPYRLLRQ